MAAPEGGRTLLLACCDGEPAVEEKLKLLKREVGRKAKGSIKYANNNKIFMGHITLEPWIAYII